MSNSNDQQTGSVNLTLSIGTEMDLQSSLTSRLLSDYEVVNRVHPEHNVEQTTSLDHTFSGNLVCMPKDVQLKLMGVPLAMNNNNYIPLCGRIKETNCDV